METLPIFKYHPDPIATGSIVVSENECSCCEQERGYIYTGPWYNSEEELDDSLCPWCIADGSAHAKFDVVFVDEFETAHWEGEPTEFSIPSGENFDIVSNCTPSFYTWQQERWLVCCGQPAIYLGPAGKVELEGQWSGAIPSIRHECQMEEDVHWNHYFEHMDKSGSPTAYIFQCSQCNNLVGFSDCD